MLQKTNTTKSLKVYTKAEVKPNFINSELQPYYEQTDLELFYVFDCCKALKPLKGIDVNSQQVEFWYKEFIRMGWKKKDFDRQFEAIKRSTLYNRIDFEAWLKTEIMYNEIDFRIKLSDAIKERIARGYLLRDKVAELTEDEKQSIDLYLSEQIKRKHEDSYFDARQTYQDERRKFWENKFKVNDGKS